MTRCLSLFFVDVCFADVKRTTNCQWFQNWACFMFLNSNLHFGILFKLRLLWQFKKLCKKLKFGLADLVDFAAGVSSKVRMIVGPPPGVPPPTGPPPGPPPHLSGPPPGPSPQRMPYSRPPYPHHGGPMKGNHWLDFWTTRAGCWECGDSSLKITHTAKNWQISLVDQTVSQNLFSWFSTYLTLWHVVNAAALFKIQMSNFNILAIQENFGRCKLIFHHVNFT